MKEVTGQIVSVVPDQVAYAVNDVVRLKTQVKVTYIPDHDWTGWWYVYCEVRNLAGGLVASASRSQTISPLSRIDYADEKIIMVCGRFARSDVLTLSLFFVSAKSIPLIYTGMKTHLATRKVAISVYEPVPVVPPYVPGVPPIEADYQCQVCGMYFTTQSGLNTHIATVHKQVTPTYYTCSYCGSNFLTQADLDTHIAKAHEAVLPPPTTAPPITKVGAAFDWKWVLIGGVVILALTMMPEEKKK